MRTMSRALGLPATIARLSVPYGGNGGWPFYHMEMILAGIPIPVPPGGPARYNLIHEDDIIATVPRLLAAASVPATTTNWCGNQVVSLQEWCEYLGTLVGREPVFDESAQALRGNPTDPAHMRELVGETAIDWRDGIHRMVATFHPGVDRRVTVVGMFVKRAQRAFAVYEGRRTHIPRNPNNVGCV